MLCINLQFFGGRGSGGGKRSGGGSAAGGATAEQKAAANKQLDAMKAPKKGTSAEITFNGRTATISKVTAGYQSKSGSNLMYNITVTDKNGERVFQTNRRGSGSFKEAKEDARLYLGLR